MDIKQFRFLFPEIGDVFGYLLFDGKSGEAAAIDGGAPEAILSFLKANNLTLKWVTNTHRHRDHITGDQALIDATGAAYLSPEELMERGILKLGSETADIIPAPGHSADSLVIKAGDLLITGDTLFNGTVGNCYTGDYEGYFITLKMLTGLPGRCRVYAGHDLRDYAMGVARELDPENSEIDGYMESRNPADEFSFLEEELKVNPFIRWNDPALDSVRRRSAGPRDTEFQRWRAMMELH